MKARVLVDQGEHKCNSVVDLPDAEAKIAVAAGWADATKEAVAYAEKQLAKAKKAQDE